MKEKYTLKHINEQIQYWQTLRDNILQSTTILICKDCKTEFEFTDKDKSYFKKQGWDNPIRCKSCQEKNKEYKEKYEGVRSTMKHTQSLKNRTKPHRVHYPPHTVGGFK